MIFEDVGLDNYGTLIGVDFERDIFPEESIDVDFSDPDEDSIPEYVIREVTKRYDTSDGIPKYIDPEKTEEYTPAEVNMSQGF